MAKYNPSLTIELYKVNKFEHKQPLEEVFKVIEKDSLEQRSRLIKQVSTRLDKIFIQLKKNLFGSSTLVEY